MSPNLVGCCLLKPERFASVSDQSIRTRSRSHSEKTAATRLKNSDPCGTSVGQFSRFSGIWVGLRVVPAPRFFRCIPHMLNQQSLRKLAYAVLQSIKNATIGQYCPSARLQLSKCTRKGKLAKRCLGPILRRSL